MIYYQVTMQHTEKTIRSLAHMQVDMFAGVQKALRSIISIAMVLFGLANSEQWWGFALLAFGCIFFTGTYGKANQTAMTIVQKINEHGLEFPSSRYTFTENGMTITILPEKANEKDELLPYNKIICIGEDREYFYLFPNEYGGYMISKEQLNKSETDFRQFIQNRTGRIIRSNKPQIIHYILQKKHEKQLNANASKDDKQL